MTGPTDPVADAEALDELLSRIAAVTGRQSLAEARRMLHGVILALEASQRECGQARETQQRPNLRAQGLEKQLAAVRRYVSRWEVGEHGTYVPLGTIVAIAKVFGHEIDEERFEHHYQRLQRVEAEKARLAGRVTSLDRALLHARAGMKNAMGGWAAEAEELEKRVAGLEATLAAVRALAAKWGGAPATIDRLLANAILAIVGERQAVGDDAGKEASHCAHPGPQDGDGP